MRKQFTFFLSLLFVFFVISLPKGASPVCDSIKVSTKRVDNCEYEIYAEITGHCSGSWGSGNVCNQGCNPGSGIPGPPSEFGCDGTCDTTCVFGSCICEPPGGDCPTCNGANSDSRTNTYKKNDNLTAPGTYTYSCGEESDSVTIDKILEECNGADDNCDKMMMKCEQDIDGFGGPDCNNCDQNDIVPVPGAPGFGSSPNGASGAFSENGSGGGEEGQCKIEAGKIDLGEGAVTL